MRRLAVALFALLALLWAQTAAAAIGFTAMGSTSGSASSLVLTVTNSCPAGDIVVAMAVWETISVSANALSDSGSNTWSSNIDTNATSGLRASMLSYSVLTTGLTGGTSTITFPFSASQSSGAVGAMCITGAVVTTLDTHNNIVNGIASTTATTVSTGTLGNATEAVVGLIATNTGTSYSCGGSFSLETNHNGGVSAGIAMCAQAVSSNASVSFAPSWTNSSTYISNVVSFMPAPTCLHTAPMLHVGC